MNDFDAVVCSSFLFSVMRMSCPIGAENPPTSLFRFPGPHLPASALLIFSMGAVMLGFVLNGSLQPLGLKQSVADL
jgi:hypothetical protein